MVSILNTLLHPRTAFVRWKHHREKLRRIESVHLVESDVLAALHEIGTVNPSGAVIVHSSLSSCGHIEGGADTVVAALRTWTGKATLVMPTHSYCYPTGSSPAPVFDAAATPSHVGAITNAFWQTPGVLRSRHPSHSIASAGPLADVLCRGHELCESPCGRDTPYERLLSYPSSALMFGATFESYTLFHTAEDAAGCEYLYYPQKYELRIRESGTERVISSLRQDMRVPRRFATMDRWLEERGLIRRLRLGLGELLFVPDVRRAHEQLVRALRDDRSLLVATSSRRPSWPPATREAVG